MHKKASFFFDINYLNAALCTLYSVETDRADDT